jgi:hypothetical protein
MSSKNGKLIFKDFEPYITSSFGWRKHPITGELKFHQGVDYGTNRKKIPQYALEEGIVLNAGTDSLGGKFVYVDYPRIGKVMLYYHLDTVAVKKGQLVNRNTVLGNTGTTGQSTGIHAHIGLFKKSEWSKPYSKRVWEDFEAFNYVPAPVKPIESLFKKGDIVIIKKPGNASSLGSGRTSYGIGFTRKVLDVLPGRLFPYRIGDNTGTTGFYAADALELQQVAQEILPGDTVIVTGIGTARKDGTGSKTKKYNKAKMKVILVDRRAKKGYALNRCNSGTPGKASDVTAWFAKGDIER